MTNKSLILGVVTTLIGTGLAAPPAQAGYVVTLEQKGSDVVATGSGAIDLTGLSFVFTNTSHSALVAPGLGEITTGLPAFTSIDDYAGITGPTSFGSGGFTFANSGSGDQVGILGLDNGLVVPHGYVSGSALSDTSTYSGQSFSSLGVTPGTYEWTWGSGPDQNFTLMAEVAAVPEPATVGLMVLGLLGAGFAGRRRRN